MLTWAKRCEGGGGRRCGGGTKLCVAARLLHRSNPRRQLQDGVENDQWVLGGEEGRAMPVADSGYAARDAA
jgi:hypothetical protein